MNYKDFTLKATCEVPGCGAPTHNHLYDPKTGVYIALCEDHFNEQLTVKPKKTCVTCHWYLPSVTHTHGYCGHEEHKGCVVQPFTCCDTYNREIERFTHQDEKSRYYIKRSDMIMDGNRIYGNAIDRLAELENKELEE